MAAVEWEDIFLSGILRKESEGSIQLPCVFVCTCVCVCVCVCVCMCVSSSVMSDSLWPRGLCPPDSLVHGILQARILEWVCHFLLEGIFLVQGSNLGLLNCRQILYHLSHQEAMVRNVGIFPSWFVDVIVCVFDGGFDYPLYIPLHVLLVSCVRLFVTPSSIALQAPLSMRFPRREYWNRLQFPTPFYSSAEFNCWHHQSCELV